MLKTMTNKANHQRKITKNNLQKSRTHVLKTKYIQWLTHITQLTERQL